LPYPAESCRILLQLWLEQTILVHFGSESFQIPAAAEIMKERIVCSASWRQNRQSGRKQL
jgi:hypothetical protein